MPRNKTTKPRVAVIGAGISGMHAALEMAEAGCHVTLIDKAPAIGGILTQLDHQFPNDHCGMCRILPMIRRDESLQFCVRKGLIHENIEILTGTTVTAIDGTPGNMSVSVTTHPEGVDQNLCTECGRCEAVCPVAVDDLFNASLSLRKAIYKPIPHQLTPKRIIDWDACTRCGECESTCPESAIRAADAAPSHAVLNTAAVIYTPGVELFDPSSEDIYGCEIQPNVVTALGFERILNSIGPLEGKPLRPSDHQPIRKIAWIQCVGSRNIMIGAHHCSTACCMFAVKEAVMAHRKIGNDVETTIFYMDMRTFGRDFQRYKDRAEQDFGVRFVRCRIHSIEPSENPGDLAISYVDAAGKLIEEVFDLAVLSNGQKPGFSLPDFARHDGVEVIDSPHRLKDISESIILSGISAGRTLTKFYRQGLLPDESGESVHPEPETGFRHEQAIGNAEIVINPDRKRLSRPEKGRPVEKSALIVGGGPAGLSAANTLAAVGAHVTLVEKEDHLGGNVSRIYSKETEQAIEKIISDVSNNPRITVCLNAAVIWSRGVPGRFVSRIRYRSGDEKILVHGAVILATGGRPAQTNAFGFGSHERIISQFDLEKQIADSAFASHPPKSVVMIQCAGSREEPANYCSRICCIKALTNAIAIKQIFPDTDIRIFYRDIMTPGDSEKIYTQARRKGILFIPFDVNAKPTVRIENEKIEISGYDPVLGENITLKPDLTVLSVGVSPNPIDELSKVFRISRTVDGFLAEADYKWRPLDTLKQGIFIAGLARAPQNAEESMKEGEAAAYRALRILSQNVLEAQKVTAVVRHAICSLCELCVESCPYGARFIDSEQNKIMVDIAACQGCGACAAVCPNSATLLGEFEDHGVMDALEDALLY